MPLEVPREKKISLQYEVCPLSSALIPNGGERIPKPYGNCHSFLYLSVKWRCRLGPQCPFLVSTLVLFICYFKRFFLYTFQNSIFCWIHVQEAVTCSLTSSWVAVKWGLYWAQEGLCAELYRDRAISFSTWSKGKHTESLEMGCGFG